MTLRNELEALHDAAVDPVHEEWKKRNVTEAFLENLRAKASQALDRTRILCETVDDKRHWRRWARENGLIWRNYIGKEILILWKRQGRFWANWLG